MAVKGALPYAPFLTVFLELALESFTILGDGTGNEVAPVFLWRRMTVASEAITGSPAARLVVYLDCLSAIFLRAMPASAFETADRAIRSTTRITLFLCHEFSFRYEFPATIPILCCRVKRSKIACRPLE